MKNWNYLHTLANEDEQLEAIKLFAETIHARQTRLVFVRGRLILERRRLQTAHYLNDRRGKYPLTRFISLLTFVLVLIAVSVATWAFALSTRDASGAIAVFFHVTALWGVYAFKPYKLRTQTA